MNVDRSAEIANREAVGGNVVCNHTAGADDAVFTNGDAWEDNRTSANPNPILNGDGFVIGAKPSSPACFVIGNDAFGRVNGVTRGVELHVWGNEYAVADGNGFVVNKCTIHVDDNVIADKNEFAIITMEGRFDHDVFPYAPEQIL